MEISASGDIPEEAPAEHRAVGLDILRGLAILMMVFSGCIPFDKPLPSWLFHAQEPTTYDLNHIVVHVFDPTHPGITFVDLVFPTFLFSLGAAIPLALTKRLGKGVSKVRLIGGGFVRLCLLCWFALYVGNLRPTILHDHPNTLTWLIALGGYALMFPMFTRLPQDWSAMQRWGTRLIGYGGGLALLVTLSLLHYYPMRLGFELKRVDVIIVALADMAFFGTLIWALTNRSSIPRLAVMAFLLAVRLGASQPGWLHNIWTYAPKNTGWLFAFDYVKYLFIVIPGTIAGDMIQRWISERGPDARNSSTPRLLGYILVVALLTLGILIGMETRHLWQTAVFSAVCCALVYWLLSKPADSTEKLAQTLMQWGVYFLLFGIAIEPFEGGIKKDPSTLSYYAVTAGIAFLLLAALMILTAIYKMERPFALLIHSGQNPMIAYVTMGNFILPILAVTHLQPLLDRAFASPWPSVALGGIETIILAYMVGYLSSRELFWRT